MKKAITTVLTLTAMLVAGCNDGSFAPKQEIVQPQFDGGSTATLTSTDTTYIRFFVDSKNTQTFALGDGNTITFPKGSMCDPNSSYGVTEWDKPCNLAKGPVTIDSKAWLDINGHAHLDFSKHVRFVPSSNPASWVMLTFTNTGIATSPWGGRILYCVTLTGCFDESLTDPSVATTTDPVTGKITRRVKHFSGYSLTSGRDEEAALSKVGITLLKP